MSSEEAIHYDESSHFEEPMDDDEAVPAWHLEIIEERMARYEKEGWPGRPWEEVEKELFDLLFSRKLSKA